MCLVRSGGWGGPHQTDGRLPAPRPAGPAGERPSRSSHWHSGSSGGDTTQQRAGQGQWRQLFGMNDAGLGFSRLCFLFFYLEDFRLVVIAVEHSIQALVVEVEGCTINTSIRRFWKTVSKRTK